MKAVAQVPGRRVGRFELLRQLGRGAQAVVWLGHDARLDREVAIKLLDASTDRAEVQEWLHEARAVSRLTHPNIVPVFEADVIDGQPTLVFEFVDGGTLSEARKGQGPMKPREAVTLMVGVLDALATAHAQGIVHRDLKPSNLLMGKDGRARVMDFGIAARVAGGGDGQIAGTPGYMSPEAARGQPPAPAMDVFAAGMVLGELLSGMPLLRERDPYRAIARVQQEDFSVPESIRIDDNLRAIVARAVARDPRQRYDGAASFRDALGVWLDPDDAGTASAGGGHGTLEFLLLRMVNTVHFANAGAGNISTISRAVALVGFAGIRNMALSVVLLEHMQDKGQAAQIKEEFLRALMAGTLAAELTPSPREAEESFIGSMFQNLGRMLTEYYFPEEAQQIRQQTRKAGAAALDRAAVQVLGLTFQELGVGVAKSWGLPESLQRMMQQPDGEPPTKPLEKGLERQRWVGRIANEVTEQMLSDSREPIELRIGRVAEAHAPSLGLQPRAVLKAAEAARTRMVALADALGIRVTPDAPANRLLATVATSQEDTLAPHQLAATLQAPQEMETVLLDAAGPPAAEVLASGVQDITNSMVADNFKLNEILRMVLETMFRGLGFRRVVFCLRDPKTETLTGRFGLGEGVDKLAPAFRIPLKAGTGTPDLFTAICGKGMDILIADATTEQMQSRLPAWFRQQVGAPTFLLLPMAMKGSTFALIYADKARAGGIEAQPGCHGVPATRQPLRAAR
jgi:eukaryotic-like serine/threonine-protein kinase